MSRGFSYKLAMTNKYATNSIVFMQIYGSNIQLVKNRANSHGRHPIYIWRCPARSRIRLLTDMLPYLIVKREAAELALKALRLIGNWHQSNERSEILQKIKKLNHRQEWPIDSSSRHKRQA